MTTTQMVMWSLWGITLLTGLGVVIGYFKLRQAEQFLPPWKELKDIEVLLPMRQEELARATEGLQKVQSQIAELEATVGHLRIIKEWQEKNPEAVARIQQLMVDLERAKSEFAAVQQKLASDEARLTQIAQEVAAAEQDKVRLNEQHSSLRQQCDSLRKENGELDRRVRDLDHQGKQLDLKLSATRNELQANENQLSTLKIRVEEASQRLAQHEARLSQAQYDVDRLTREKAHLIDEIAQLQKQAGAAKDLHDRLQKQVQELTQKEGESQSRLTSLKYELENAEGRMANLAQQVKQAEQDRAAMIRERDQARADRDAARAELGGLEKAIEASKAIAQGIQTQLQQSGVAGQGNYADLFAPLPFPALAKSKTSPSEEESLKRARSYIRSKGLVFPDRILHAFHTSLKASDISPLVVLAGISGTGKSELPRQYADGMGIHFLLTAVQPRWDSPQDLFGFYNYLERRYKATELSRVLVQFELFKTQKLKDWKAPTDSKVLENDRSDRLLIVLLDEMNLARTEYYFSEFLSKLETRRMVNEEKVEDRARAEIDLDMGSLLDGQKSIRLFPGKNILFVGTMNEDESTQSLSDKVIDRASVLRFWRPKKTNPEISANGQVPTKEGLPFETWKEWIRPHTELGAGSNEVNGWIEQLNAALDRIGRPFAYRVDRAIRTYIANYPRWVPDAQRRAMADQIEQRIFPKLRGIEPDQDETRKALRSIGNLIDQLGDQPLKKAFEASHENQPTFLFRGVVRDEQE